MLNFQLLLCLLLSVTGLCVADPESVYGKKGSSIIFICPYKGNSTNNVAWEFVYNASTFIPISDGYFISNSPIKDRVIVVGNHTAEEYNLELRQLQEYDELVYRCSVSSHQKEYKLELIASPSSLTLQDATDKILGTEGQSLTLRCTATGGKPPPLVTITVDNVPRSAIQSVAYTVPLERRHDGLSVRCDANSSALTSPLVAMATLFLQLKPLQPIFSPDLVSIEETKPLVVSCTSSGSRPAATFQWTIGFANVTYDSTTQSTVNTADNTYTVTSTLRHNVDKTYSRQNITCTAVNVAANNGTSKMLDVKFAPDITVTNVTYNQNYANRTVTCNLVGNPTTYTYFKWQHKSMYGVLIRELDGGQNGVLTLTNIPVEDRYQDSGEYVCTANNGITGRDGRINQTGSAYITVNATQVLLKSRNHTEYGEFGKDVDVHVYVYSFPKYRSVRWYKTNTPISTTDKYALADTATIVTDTFHGTLVQLDGYRITLTIKNLTESDFNVSYRVEMENNVGLLNYTIFLVSASAPQTPINFRALNSTQSSILVQWEAGYDGGQEQTFYVEYRRFGSNVWMRVKIQDSKQTGRQIYKLTGLQDGTLYELRMYAENKFNKSLPTHTVKLETTQDCKCTSTEALNGGVAGGLTAVIVIMLIIIIVLILRKQKIIINRPITHTSRWKNDASYRNPMECKGLNEQEDDLSGRNKHSARLTEEYETMAMKDNPNTYSELLTQQDKQILTSVQVYETLGMADNPNTYSELQGKKDQMLPKTTADQCQPEGEYEKVTIYENTKI